MSDEEQATYPKDVTPLVKGERGGITDETSRLDRAAQIFQSRAEAAKRQMRAEADIDSAAFLAGCIFAHDEDAKAARALARDKLPKKRKDFTALRLMQAALYEVLPEGGAE